MITSHQPGNLIGDNVTKLSEPLKFLSMKQLKKNQLDAMKAQLSRSSQTRSTGRISPGSA